MLRVAVVGARRNRQGTGEYVARELARAGCQVTCVVGTSPASVEDARAGLAARHGIEARGYTSLPELLEREQVDAVAICSPHHAHLEALRTALAAGCHVFCEKPLWWREGLAAGVIEETVHGLLEQLAPGRTLVLNTQWPQTLAAFDALHPGVRQRPLQRFDFHLAPNNPSPRQMVVDSGSHLISMLQALAGPGELGELSCELVPDGTLQLRGTYQHARGSAQLALDLRPQATIPRPAGYAVNGCAVERRIALPDYSFSFEADDGRQVPAEDPLVGSVRDFVQAAQAGRSPDPARILAGMIQLHQLASTATQEVVWPST